jgi:hypothetical protein
VGRRATTLEWLLCISIQLPHHPAHNTLLHRYCFTVRELASSAPAFDHLCRLVHVPGSGRQPDVGGNAVGQLGLVATRINVEDVPQMVADYVRGSQMELLSITLKGPALG